MYDDRYAPWAQRDTEQCPQCNSTSTVLTASDGTYEDWECEECFNSWYIQTGRDPDDANDQRRDDQLTLDIRGLI